MSQVIPKAAPHYINNKTLLAQVKQSKEKGHMTNELATSLMLLAERYSKHSNFANYSYIQDMRSFAMLMLVRTWNSFDLEKSDNPFAFYTQCIKNSFKQFLNQEKKQRTVRDKMMVDQGLNPSQTYVDEYNSNDALSRSGSYEDEQDFDIFTPTTTFNKADERFGNSDEAFEDDLIDVADTTDSSEAASETSDQPESETTETNS